MNETTQKTRGPVFAALCAALIAPGTALAAGLTQADTNGDGKISRAEAITAQDKAFKRFDTDGNGVLDLKEFEAGQMKLPANADKQDQQRRKQMLKSWFHRIDSNNNNKISKSEYRQALKPYFDRLDTNNNGSISADELRRVFHKSKKHAGSNQ